MCESIKLADCPFCQHSGKSLYVMPNGEQYVVMCTRKSCEAIGPRRDTERSAAAAWNASRHTTEVKCDHGVPASRKCKDCEEKSSALQRRF